MTKPRILDMPTPFELSVFQKLLDEDTRKREETIEKFFTAETLRTADALLWTVGTNLSLTPKED